MSEVIHASQGYVEKTARTIAAEEVAKVVTNAPQDFDTLKEIADYIESDKTGAAQMMTKIEANAKAIRAEEERAQDAEAQLTNKVKELVSAKADKTALEAEAKRAEEAETALGKEVAKKVDAVEGKGLSANDYTDKEKEKLGKAYTPDNPPPTPDLSGYAKKDDIPSLDGYAKKSDIPYALIEVPLADSINLTDRAVNKVTTDDTVSSITFIFPEKKEGVLRDFFLRLVITGETVPTLLFVEPTGEPVSFDSDNDSWADIEQGVNILMFTDTEE